MGTHAFFAPAAPGKPQGQVPAAAPCVPIPLEVRDVRQETALAAILLEPARTGYIVDFGRACQRPRRGEVPLLESCDTRWFGRCAAALLLAALAACAKPTPYMAAVEGEGGYAEQKLEENRYRVTFAGNSVTNRETVENYLLYRAAEVTIETGNDYFQIANRDTDTSTTYHTTGPDIGVFGGRGGWGGGWGWGVGTNFGTATPSRSFTAIADIIVHKGEKPVGDVNSYNARDVLNSLGPTILRPEAAETS
jgi:hypothetical protein